jgi:hypothetical protein
MRADTAVSGSPEIAVEAKQSVIVREITLYDIAVKL